MKDYTKALEYDPGHFGAYFHRARIYLQFKHCVLAFQDCEKARELFEKPNPFLFHWIYPFFEIRDFDFLYGKNVGLYRKRFFGRRLYETFFKFARKERDGPIGYGIRGFG